MELQDKQTAAHLRKIIGYADACELMATVFRFPNEDLTRAFIDGSFLSDVRSCLIDSGADVIALNEACEEFTTLEMRNEPELLDSLRKGYSILFLTPGSETPVWPYEAAFRHVASGKTEPPVLFRAPITLDVETMMHASGVSPLDARAEPADSVWNELEYLSYTYGKAAQAIYDNDPVAETTWLMNARSFVIEHAGKWLSDFMIKTVKEAGSHSYGEEYSLFARIGALTMRGIETDTAMR